MKTSMKMKGLLLLAISAFFGANVNAQTATTSADDNYDQGFKLGFGVNGGLVFDDPYDWSLGADARLQYDLSQRTSLTLTTGFTNLFIGDDIEDLGFIPVKAGFKGFIWEDRFYIMGEVGAGFAVTNDYDDTTLILAPSIGYANKYFDASVRYEYLSDFPTLENDGTVDKGVGQIVLRLAYGFKL